MTPLNTPLCARSGRDRWIVLFLFLTAFLVRIPLINWFYATYTDGILYITFYYNDSTFIAPLYGFLVEPFYNLFTFIPTHEMAGRFLSILFGSLSVIPVYLTGRFIFNEKTGIYDVLLYIFSALVLRWNLRVMTDSLFTLIFFSCVYCYLKFYFEPKRWWLFWGFFLSGLAVLSRYQGLAFIPFTAFLWLREIRARRPKAVLVSLLGSAPWLVFLWWTNYRKFEQTDVFQRSITGIAEYAQMMKGYLLLVPYSLTYPVFALFCYGAYRAWKVERGRVFLLSFASVLVIWLVMHTAYMEMQSRFFMPLFPFFMIFAAYGITHIKRERAVLAAALAVSIAFSAAVLHYQRDSFGDIKRAAKWVGRNVSPEATVYATDLWAMKSKFWAQRNIEEYKPPGSALRPGDYVLFNSFNINVDDAIKRLKWRFDLETVYETTSTIVPLLTDVTNPTEYTLKPEWRRVKYKKNVFRSVVLKVLEKGESQDGHP